MQASGRRQSGTRATIDHARIAYTVKDAARLVSLSARQLYRLIASGEFPAEGVIREGRAVRVYGGALSDWIEEKRQANARRSA